MRADDRGSNPPSDNQLIAAILTDPAFKASFQRRTRTGKWACIEWIGGRNRGYGQLAFAGHTMLAHRVAWIFRHGYDAPLDLDHLCVNAGCVNPDHLEPVTGDENYWRRLRPPPGWVSVRNKKYPRRRKLKGTRANTPPSALFPAEEA